MLPATLLVSCDRRASRVEEIARTDRPATAPVASEVETLDPLGVVRRLHERRVARRWFDVAELVDPDQRPAITHLLRATDSLLDANDRLQRAIAVRHDTATAIAFDRSRSGDALGVFSMNVRVLDQRLDGDRAIVIFQVADRVPLEQVELVRLGGRWLVHTDPPIPGIPEQIERLAGALLEIAARLEREPMSVDELSRALEARTAPVLRQLARLTTSDP